MAVVIDFTESLGCCDDNSTVSVLDCIRPLVIGLPGSGLPEAYGDKTMTVFKSVRKALIALAAAGLGVFGLGVSANAAASCACMCIEGVSYEVCTGVVTTQAISQECTETLQCPVDTSTDETDSDVSAPEGSDSSAIDCRMRNVYRPDRGRYEPHPVCMPAEAVAAHERMKARHAEIADRFEARHGRAHRLAELGEGRARGRRHDDDDRRGRGRRDGDDD